MPAFPDDRNLNGELGGVTAGVNQLTGAAYDNANQFGGAWTVQNLRNYGLAIGGEDMDYSGGAAGLLRQGWQQANPELTAYTAGLGGTLQGYGGPARFDPTGYNAHTFDGASAGPAAQARFSGARAQYAGGGPLLGQLQSDAGGSLNRFSPIESGLQRQAMGLLSAGGGLTAGELSNVQQSVRGAYADRGLYRSNRGVGAEILATDQAQRQRMFENSNFAAGISGQLEQSRNASRNYAMGVQGQGQQLSQFNAGLGTNVSTFNAGQRNSLAQYNAGAQNQQNQYNAGLAQQAGLYNAGANNAAQQFNVDAVNTANQYNAGLATAAQDQDWQRQMQYGQFQLQQAQNPAAYAAGLSGGMPDYTSLGAGYAGDLYNTNYNAAAARAIGQQNNKAGIWSSVLGAVGTVGGAIVGGPIGASIGGAIGSKLGGGN